MPSGNSHKEVIFFFMKSPAALSDWTAVELFPRSTKTAPDAIRYPPNNGASISSFLAMIDACFGKILDNVAIRRAPRAGERKRIETTNQFHVARWDTIVIIDWNVPPEEKDIESALVISDKDSRFNVEVLFTFYDEFDIQQFSSKGIK